MKFYFSACARRIVALASVTFVAMLFAACQLAPQPARNVRLDIKEVATGFNQPLYITNAGDGSGRIFIVEHAGVIKILKDGKTLEKPFLDISAKGLDRVSRPKDESDERGLLGVAFHPDYEKNGRFFVHYTKVEEDTTIIAEYKVSADDPNVAGAEEKIILGPIKQPQWNHNGGMVEFGPDGYLYIGMGDGGFRDDTGPGHNPEIGNGQDTATLLGKILRIDVDKPQAPLAYGIPKDNPFVGKDPAKFLPEIYATGMRNPWRFSFDRKTGRLFCGDVGQKLWEEVNIIENGGNYGWRFMEGNQCFNPAENCELPGMKRPIHVYDHSEDKGGLSITGGYVYRGKQFPAMNGLYVFADYSSSRIWTLREEKDGTWTSQEHLRPQFYIPTFGEDEAGEIYLCNKFRGVIFQVTAEEVKE